MNLSVIWRLNDLMTPVMNKVTRTATSTQAAIDKASTVMSAKFRKTGDSVTSLRDKLKAIEGYRDKLVIGVDDREIRRANRGVAHLNQQLDKYERRNKAQQGGFGGLKGLAAGFGAYQAGAAAMGFLGKGMDLEVSEKLFQNQAGGQAAQIMNNLNQWQQKYPVYAKDMLTESAKTISSTFGSENVMAVTNMVGKLAQGNTDHFKSILTRLEQIKGTGYLQGDELQELMRAGLPDVAEQLAKIRGVSLEKFNALKSKGLISANEVISGLEKMTQEGGKYEKGLDIAMSATKGKWAIIKNTVNNAATEMGKKTAEGLGKAMDWVIRFMNRSKPITTAFSAIKRAFNPLLNGLLRIAQSFGLVSKDGDSVTVVVNTLAKAMNVVAWVMEKVAGAVQWVADVFEKYPWVKYVAGFLAMNYAVKSFGSELLNLRGRGIDTFWKLADFPFNVIGSGIVTIVKTVNMLRNAFVLMNAANPVVWIIAGVAALAAAFYIAWQRSDTFRQVVTQTWEAAKMLWSDIVKWVQEAWASIQPYITAIGKLWSIVWGIIGKVAQVYWAYLKGMFSGITQPLVKAFEWAKEPILKFWNWLKDSALKAMRITAGIMTLGLSEVAIWGGKKLKEKYWDPAGDLATKIEQGRKVQAATPKNGVMTKLGEFGSQLGFNFGAGGKGGNPGAEIGKASGLTDTVNGSTSKNITINLNSKIADIFNTFNGADNPEDLGGKVTDIVLMELNRILMTGNRLALE